MSSIKRRLPIYKLLKRYNISAAALLTYPERIFLNVSKLLYFTHNLITDRVSRVFPSFHPVMNSVDCRLLPVFSATCNAARASWFVFSPTNCRCKLGFKDDLIVDTRAATANITFNHDWLPTCLASRKW
jgi:hypothetical protein